MLVAHIIGSPYHTCRLQLGQSASQLHPSRPPKTEYLLQTFHFQRKQIRPVSRSPSMHWPAVFDSLRSARKVTDTRWWLLAERTCTFLELVPTASPNELQLCPRRRTVFIFSPRVGGCACSSLHKPPEHAPKQKVN